LVTVFQGLGEGAGGPRGQAGWGREQAESARLVGANGARRPVGASRPGGRGQADWAHGRAGGPTDRMGACGREQPGPAPRWDKRAGRYGGKRA
jgi:hypothetical protein